MSLARITMAVLDPGNNGLGKSRGTCSDLGFRV